MGNSTARETVFRMKRFEIINSDSAMKPGTDGVLLGAWASAENPQRIIDVGTGTGLIAMMLAQRYEHAIITAVEIDPVAAAEAEQNFINSPWHDRLITVTGDFSKFLSFSKFDLIVSNPPFFTSGKPSPDKSRAMARHESSLPLGILFQQAKKLLSDRGRLAIITPCGNEDEIIFEAAMKKIYPWRICEVISVEGKTPIRIMWEFSLSDDGLERESIIIRDRDNNFTDTYKELTKEFYLDF